MIIYVTQERPGYHKHDSSWYEYCLENGKVIRYKCRRWKSFEQSDHAENVWHKTRKPDTSWSIDDPSMPTWLRKKMSDMNIR